MLTKRIPISTKKRRHSRESCKIAPGLPAKNREVATLHLQFANLEAWISRACSRFWNTKNHRYPQSIALAGRENGVWRKWTTAEVLAERDRLSAGLLHLGLQKGDRVGMLAHGGSPQWAIADAAMLQIGIVPVPIHSTARPDEMVQIAQDANLRACWVSNAAMLEKLRIVDIAPEYLLGLEALIGTRSWADLLREPNTTEQAQIRALRDSISPDDLATLLYTSGTTGVPKGVMLSHANIVSNVKSVLAIVPVGSQTTTLSFLPLSHIFERMVTYVYQAAGHRSGMSSRWSNWPTHYAKCARIFLRQCHASLNGCMSGCWLSATNKGVCNAAYLTGPWIWANVFLFPGSEICLLGIVYSEWWPICWFFGIGGKKWEDVCNP